MNKPDRPRRTDGAATRVRILEAAGTLFAARGYGETTSKAIAIEANVDLASINYHFGSRDGLYQAVLAEAHNRFISHSDLSHIIDSPLSADDQLGKLIESLIDRATHNHDWSARVLSRELVSSSSHLQQLFDNEIQPKLSGLKHLISEITQIPIEAPALTRCLLNVAAPCLMLLVIGRNTPGPLQEILHMPQATLTQHLHSFALAGLKEMGHAYHAGLITE